MSAKYEVVLGPAAIRTVLGLPDLDRKELAEALRMELHEGPNAEKAVRFDGDLQACDMCAPDDVVYTGTPLTAGAYLAVHRPLTRSELQRLRQEQGRRVAADGFYVLDILHPAPAFSGGPRMVGHL